tara:strand:+ start:627 stop:1307 length:681 start_codon:yes stop_codon:yes gene_type:complete
MSGLTPAVLQGLLVVMAVGFFLLHAAENNQLVARISGYSRGKVAGGYQSAMEGMLINRVGAVLYHLVTSFYVENGGHVTAFLASILVCSFLLLVFNIFLLNKLTSNTTNEISEMHEPGRNKLLITASYIAPIFILFGLSIPYALGMIFFDYRLTLANTGFLFNSFFTLVTVIVIDKRISAAIDDVNGDPIRLARLVLRSRIAGIGTFIVILLILKLQLLGGGFVGS